MDQTPAHDLHNDTILAILNTLRPESVVEFGCMRGSLAKKYRETVPDSLWYGIDIDEDNVRHSSEVCTEAMLADIEALGVEDFKRFGPASAWVFGDVLEHLRDPRTTLRRIREAIQPDGRLVACIPNSQHWSFQARVNAGLMQYDKDGLFDRTHVRFFSRQTMVSLFESTGYKVESVFTRTFNFPGYEKYIPFIRGMASASGVNADQAVADAMPFNTSSSPARTIPSKSRRSSCVK